MGNDNILKKLYLFKDLAASEIEIVKKATKLKTYMLGEEVFSQGENAHALYIIERGSIRIHQTAENGESIEITRIGPGSHFGEMAFLDGEARSATAAVIEESEVLEVNYDKLSEIMIEHPGIAVHFYRQFAIFLCGRLRITTQDLSFSRSKIISHF